MKKFGKWSKVLFVWGAILLSALLLIEARYTWGSYEGKYTIYHTLHPKMGIWHAPNQHGVRYASCYAIEDIYINSLGMRAAEPDSSKRRKIAYFGDSMLEGVQVSQEDHFIYQLNRLDSLRDHLNFGMSSTGTAAQWAHFQHFLTVFDFEEVYLFFYPANDLRNNSLELETRANGGKRGYLPHFVRDTTYCRLDTAYWKLDTAFSPWGGRQWLNHSDLFRKLKLIRAQQKKSFPQNNPAIPYHDLEVYQPTYDPVWQEAEVATRYAIQLFADSCAARGIAFTLVLLPSLNELLNPEERAQYHPSYHNQLDWEKPHRRFKAFCEEKQIPYLDFFSVARKAIEEEKLAFPYLSLSCDGHYGKVGHGLLREMLVGENASERPIVQGDGKYLLLSPNLACKMLTNYCQLP